MLLNIALICFLCLHQKNEIDQKAGLKFWTDDYKMIQL